MDGDMIQIRKHGTPLKPWAIITVGYGKLYDLDKSEAADSYKRNTLILSFGLKLPWKRRFYDICRDEEMTGRGWLCWLQRRGWFLTGVAERCP